MERHSEYLGPMHLHVGVGVHWSPGMRVVVPGLLVVVRGTVRDTTSENTLVKSLRRTVGISG